MVENVVPEVVTLSLPSQLEMLGVLDRVALALCERLELGDDVAGQVSMAVIEAGTNAVQHGNKRDASKQFEARFLLFPDRLEVFVHDQGAGFDLAKLTADVTTPEHLFDMRGRGIFIMKACCDTVEFQMGATGTVCHLVKLRSAEAPHAAGA